jgi:maleate cis-trans isomerase
MPVLTSNQCMAWHLLRSRGIDGAAGDYGRLFSVAKAAA